MLEELGGADEGQQAGAHNAGAIKVGGDVVGLVAGRANGLNVDDLAVGGRRLVEVNCREEVALPAQR